MPDPIRGAKTPPTKDDLDLQQAEILLDLWQSDSSLQHDIAERILLKMRDDELQEVHLHLWKWFIPQPVRIALGTDLYQVYQPWHFTTPLEDSTSFLIYSPRSHLPDPDVTRNFRFPYGDGAQIDFRRRFRLRCS
jgi:hypothetical protein